MRLLGRLVVVVAAASVPAVVTLIGCGVQGDRYPGLENEVPNNEGTVPPSVSGSSSSSSSSSSTSSSSSSGALSLNICQCALTFLMPSDGGACTPCGSTAAGGACLTEQTDCNMDPTGACQAAFICINGCSNPASWNTCVALCIQQSPVYQTLVTCQCNQCQQQCAVATPITCDLGADAGADAPSDG